MNIGDYGTLGRLIFDSSTVKSQLDTLTAQAGSGLVSSSYGGLGAAAQTPLTLAPQIASLATRQATIGAVTGQMTVTQTAMTQIALIASGFNAQLAELNSVTPAQIDSVAVSARSALQEVAGLLDSVNGNTYVFAGTDSATPPVPNPGSITTSGFYTQVGAAVAALGANGAAATIATTLAVATSDVAGTTPFSGAPGQAPTVELGTGAPAQVGVLANANTLAVSGGTSSTGSYMRDIMRSLATLANLSSGQARLPGFAALVSDTGSSLSGAISAMGIEQGALGGIQSSLTTVGTEAGETSTALSAQVSSVEDVDMAKTLSELSQVQTQLTASYKLISEVKGLSLANFL
jgi:flagellar hook-associated protein 3 FlgL